MLESTQHVATLPPDDRAEGLPARVVLDAMQVVLVDDSPEIQQGLTRMLESIPDVEVVGCAADVEGALELIAARRPDVVILDVALRGHERGMDVLRPVVRGFPRTRVAVLSNFGWDAMREAFLAEGARACFDKAFDLPAVREWVRRQAQDGAASIPPSMGA